MAGPPLDDQGYAVGDNNYGYYDDRSWDSGYSGPVVYYGGGSDGGCDGYGDVSQADSGSAPHPTLHPPRASRMRH